MTTMLNNLFEWTKTLFNILFLSFTSPKFYADVFAKYKGYGIKYMLTISMVSSLLICIVMMQTTEALNDYFVHGKLSEKVKTLDRVINQIPVMKYKDSMIALEEETPIIIAGIDNKPIVMIDPEGKSSYREKSKVPIYFGSKQITLNEITSEGGAIKSFSIKYKSIFASGSNEDITIDSGYIRQLFLNYLPSLPNIIIIAVHPLLSLFIFVNTVLQKMISILILTVIFYFYHSKFYLKESARVIFFSAGVVILAQTIAMITMPFLLTSIWIVELWTNFLLVFGLVRLLSSKKQQ